MGIGRFLNHTVSIVRREPMSTDDYGQDVMTEQTVSTVAAGIQPKSAREVAAIHQAGSAIADHTVYLLPTDVTTGDVIIHSADDCPFDPDLPDGRYEIVSVPSAAGAAHHLEVSARLIGSPLEAVGAVEGGS